MPVESDLQRVFSINIGSNAFIIMKMYMYAKWASKLDIQYENRPII